MGVGTEEATSNLRQKKAFLILLDRCCKNMHRHAANSTFRRPKEFSSSPALSWYWNFPTISLPIDPVLVAIKKYATFDSISMSGVKGYARTHCVQGMVTTHIFSRWKYHTEFLQCIKEIDGVAASKEFWSVKQTFFDVTPMSRIVRRICWSLPSIDVRSRSI